MKKIIIFTAFLVGFLSCQEDEFLKETPKDDIFADNLFQNYDGFINGLNGLYALMRQEVEEQEQPAYLWKIGVDNAFSSHDHGGTRPLNDYNLMNSEYSVVNNTFQWLYRLINTANTIINRATDEVDWQGGSEEGDQINKNKVIAHAKLIRACAYRHLTGCWGAVPLSTEEINGSNYKSDWERSPVSEIQELMEQDWMFARDNLNMVEKTGFANSAVASHYLAELYLTQGKYSESEIEAKRVINSDEYHLMTEKFGTYDIIPNPPPADSGVVFMDIFANPSREDGNMEVLWTFNNAHESIIGSIDGGSKNTWIMYSTKANSLKKLDSEIFYRYNGGRGRGRGTISDSAFDWYESGDDRFSKYAVKKYYVYPQDEENESDFEIIEHTEIKYKKQKDLTNNFLWPWSRKWEYVDPIIPANSDKSWMWRSEMYLRLAETYLVLAEALHKNGKD